MSDDPRQTADSEATTWVRSALAQGLSLDALARALQAVSAELDLTPTGLQSRSITTVDWRPLADEVTDTSIPTPPSPATAVPSNVPDPTRYEDCGLLGTRLRGFRSYVHRQRVDPLWALRRYPCYLPEPFVEVVGWKASIRDVNMLRRHHL